MTHDQSRRPHAADVGSEDSADLAALIRAEADARHDVEQAFAHSYNRLRAEGATTYDARMQALGATEGLLSLYSAVRADLMAALVERDAAQVRFHMTSLKLP